MSQPQPRHQFTAQDNQMLQRQLMLKQFQELQKHRQFPPLSDGRQQNYLSDNFMSATPTFIPHGAYVSGQGFQNGTFSQPQTQNLFLTNPSQQPVNNFYQTPTASSINNCNQNISPSLQFLTNGGFQSKQFTNGKTLFGQEHNQSFQQMNGSLEQFHGNTTKADPSQGVATLDPLEQKILFNMDGNGWSSSFGTNSEDFNSNTVECSDYLSSFPSIQSGSWSALMQNAVGESSSESGVVQEEWSGVNFQNTELSMDNKPVNNVANGNQQFSWINNNAASSLNNVTNISSGFPGFQLPNQEREENRVNLSHESEQQSSRDGAKGLDDNYRQGQHFKESQPNHTIQTTTRNAFPFQGFQFSDGSAEQRNLFAKSNDQTGFNSYSQASIQQGNQNMTSAAVEKQSLQVIAPSIANKLPPFDLFASRGASQSGFSFDHDGQQFPVLESVPVESSKRPPSLWPNTSFQTRPSDPVPQERPSNFRTSSNPININLQKISEGSGFEPVAKHVSQENGVGPYGGDKQMPYVSTTDFEAFGRSLKPSNLPPNCSSSSEINHELGSVPVHSLPLCTYRDRNMQSAEPSSLPNIQNTAQEIGTKSPSFSHSDYNVSDMALQGTEYSQVNSTMALRNGQMLSMCDRKEKNAMNPYPLGKQMENLKMKAPIFPMESPNSEKISHSCTLSPNFRSTDISMTKSRKRKTATSDLLPWHMEVTLNSKRTQSISTAETEWAKAVNRLSEKVDYGNPVLRPHKRLVLTTQLMQLVFMPSPSTFLRANLTSNYESFAYLSAKVALGNACNLNSRLGKDSGLSSTSDNMMTEDSRTSKKIIEKDLSTIVESFNNRAEKLESNFARLDKTASVLNVIIEHKELEKFSLINRFARFHVRGPQKETETSTSSGSTSSLLKPAPQRYVMVIRARSLPENTRCLAL